MRDDEGYDERPEPSGTTEECPKCHAPAVPGTPSVTSVGAAGVVTVFHTEECFRELTRELDEHRAQDKRRGAEMRRGLAALRAHLRDHPPAASSDAAPYAAVLAELVERYLLQDMRGRYVVHQDVFDVIGRHLPHVPGIDGTTPVPASGDGATRDLEPFTVPDDDSELLAWVLDHGGTIPYDGDLQYRPDPLHRIVLPDGGSIVVAPGDRLLGGQGTIHLAVPDHPAGS
ncbi:hypothetical protein [Yinghuangia sp. YIM S10712]|uniref:hypothetical protein n=1 Tax=Yinghuangia sp. YIM S10712 TaxID=3436930 RepID=UPI003F536A6C